MRPKKFTITTSALETPLYRIPFRQGDTNTTAIFSPLTGVTPGTINAFVTNSDLGHKIPCTVSQTTTSVTITFASAHELIVGDYVFIQGTGVSYIDTQLKVATVTNATVVVCTVATSASVATRDAYATPVRVATVAMNVANVNTIGATATGVIFSALSTNGTIVVEVVTAGVS